MIFRKSAVLRILTSPLFLVIMAYLILQLLTFRTDIGAEEFRDILSFQQFNAGLIPYRDFYWHYGPLGIYLWSFFIKFLGSELILMRLAAIFTGIIGIIVVYRLSKKIMSNNFSLLAAFCSFALFTFPCYSFNHYLSVISLLITLLFVVKFLSDKKRIHLFMWGVFLTLTFLIRPAPTGIILALVSLLTIVLFSLKFNFFVLLKNILYLFTFFTVAITSAYFLTGGLFLKSTVLLITINNGAQVILGFPDTIRLVRDFLYSLNVHILKDVRSLYNILTFINLISSHVICWFIFIFPAIFIGMALYELVTQRRLQDITRINYLAIFLFMLSFLLSLYFLDAVLATSYPNFDGWGRLWLLRGQYILQPGIIFFSYLLYRFKKRTSAGFLTTAISCVLILSVTLPKISDLRYLFIKMPVGNISGIRGVYLTNFWEKIFVPAIEYINNEKDIPEYIFVTCYFPGFYALANKKSILPEDAQALFTNLSIFKKGRKNFYPSSTGYNPSDEEGADRIILNRLKDKKPCVVTVNDDLLKYHFLWGKFIMDNYHAVKKFTYKRIITSKDTNNNPAVTIYLPNSIR